MYYKERGLVRKGKPVVIIHGGPGGGLEETVPRRSFNLKRWWVIQYDQRGCGRSTPTGLEGLHANTTPHLVADLERLRVHLGLDKWAVFGGSWGSTLALVYAETHPDRVSSLVLRGIYLRQPWETDWLYKEGGASRLKPEAWTAFVAPLSVSDRRRNVTPVYRRNVTRAYRRLLHSKSRATRKVAANAWTRYENTLSFLKEKRSTDSMKEKENMALIENHYFYHNCWLKPGQILKGAGALTDIPTEIVQGRYDLVCPPAAALQLKEALPHARLVLTHSGHAGSEPETAAALRAATNRLL
jgi:proline iminopeptidase